MEFRAWPKITRWSSPYVITEKIDGTNACVIVHEPDGCNSTCGCEDQGATVTPDGSAVWAQSRTRIITPENDNHGFARWVHENCESLSHDLGPGYHYGE